MSSVQPFFILTDDEYAAIEATIQEERRLDFHGRYASALDWKERFAVIRSAYAYHMPSIMQAARSGHTVDANIVTWQFSPIEDAAWCQLRALGLPFYPQVPVLEYFADFADPFHKIILELDGKQFHDLKKDDIRDKRLRKAGWNIHRIPGRVAYRYLEDVYSEDTAFDIEEAINSEYPFSEENRRYIEMAESTLDGYLLAIRRRYYTKD